MTENTVTDERLGKFARKQHDWFERVRKGSLDPILVERAVQEIIDTAPRGRYANEEVSPSFGYPSRYKRPVGIETQIDILRSYWPQLNPDGALRYARGVYPSLQLPGWVEGPFAIIRPGFFSENDGEEIAEVLSALARSRDGKFVNYRPEQMDRFRRHSHTVAAYDRIVEQQNGSDILVVGSQFGIRYRGRSVHRTREAIMDVQGEFGEGAKNVGTMLLTNPERLKHFIDLRPYCPGNKLDDPRAADCFALAPFFVFIDGAVGFGANLYNHASNRYGSVSGFVPQS